MAVTRQLFKDPVTIFTDLVLVNFMLNGRIAIEVSQWYFWFSATHWNHHRRHQPTRLALADSML